MFEQIRSFFNEYRSPIIITLVIVLVSATLIILVHYVTHKAKKMAANKRASSVALLLDKIITYCLIIVSILAILGVWGFNINALLWGFGIIAIIIGLSAHKLIHDILVGIVMVFGNYYEVDDIVEIKGFKGRVVAIRTRSTHLLNNRGELKIFAHGEITEVINYSKHFSLASISVMVDHHSPIDEMMMVLQEKCTNLVDSFPQIVEGPNVIGITDLRKEGIELSITAKTQCEQQYEVERAIKKIIGEVFIEHGYKYAKDEVLVTHER